MYVGAVRCARAFVVVAVLGCDEVAPARDASYDATADACDGACAVCAPGARSCSDDERAVLRCRDDGLAREVAGTCSAGTRCAAGACVSPCAWAAATHSYLGCDFHAVGTLNSGLGRYYAGASREDFPFVVTVTNPWATEVTVTLDGGGLAAPRAVTVEARSARTVSLPWVRTLSEGGDPERPRSARVERGAVHLRASLPVGAWQFNPEGFVSTLSCGDARCFSYTNDASLLLPTASLSMRYVAVTRPTVRLRAQGQTQWRRASGFVAIAATAEGFTDVTVRLRGRTEAGESLAAGAPGETLRARLAQGEVWQLVSDASGTCATPEPDTVRGDVFCRPVAAEDLTGTAVESSAPVAVFAGHDCALVPYDRFACDHLEEQMLPVESLGRRYVVARTPPWFAEPDVLRVVATHSDTRVIFEPARAHDPVTLADVGDFVEFEQRESVAVTGTEALLVAQFLVGGSYDRARSDEGRGDPDMVLAPPIEQTRSAYDFVAATGFPTNTAIVTVPTGEGLVLDGARVTTAPYDRVAGYDVLHLAVSEGAHHIESARAGVRFGLIVSGLAPSTSYTYAAGLDLAPISTPQ